MPWAGQPQHARNVPSYAVPRIMFRQWLHFNNRCHHLRCHQIKYIYDGITIHINIVLNLSRMILFIWGLPLQPYTTTIPTKGQNCISYQHLCRSLLIRCSSPHPRRPKLPTALSISHFTRRNCAIHIPIYSRHLKERSFPAPTINCSASSNQTATPAVEPQTTVDVLSRSRRSIFYAHVMIGVAARLRMISPIPSLLNRRGNNLHI
jgi:hypothetical protein